jgi:glycosyltransferase involved in cell wall biosynthesis
MSEHRIRLGIVNPSDPVGSLPGGIESFIRGTIRCAPDDIDISVIGVTTDPVARPVGCWTDCTVRGSSYRHFPVSHIPEPGARRRIPETARFMAGVLQHRRELGRFDVLEFHRIEPVALFLSDATPKTAVFHHNTEVIRTTGSDIRWKHSPTLYFLAEKLLIRRLQSAFFVGQDAVEACRRRYPALADRFRSTPTWMDPEIFFPFPPHERTEMREQVMRPLGIRDSDRILITVGRLDSSKDPLLLAEAFAQLCRTASQVRLVFVGDGALRVETEQRLRALGVIDRVSFAGLLPPPTVARYLNASDLFVLSSAYEGMPIAALEALACGLPVCTTDVGDVRRAVTSGVNGEVIAERTPTALAQALARCLERLDSYRGAPAVAAAGAFVPEKVLAPFYANYRRLASARREAITRA